MQLASGMFELSRSSGCCCTEHRGCARGIFGRPQFRCVPLQVASIAEDRKLGLLDKSDDNRQGGEGLRLLLRDKNVDHVPFEGWKKIDAVEVERGAAIGKPREKLVDIRDMVQVAESILDH